MGFSIDFQTSILGQLCAESIMIVLAPTPLPLSHQCLLQEWLGLWQHRPLGFKERFSGRFCKETFWLWWELWKASVCCSHGHKQNSRGPTSADSHITTTKNPAFYWRHFCGRQSSRCKKNLDLWGPASELPLTETKSLCCLSQFYILPQNILMYTFCFHSITTKEFHPCSFKC